MKRKSFIFLCFIIVLIISLMGCSNKGNGPATNYTLNITIEGEGDVNLDPDRSSYSEGTAVDITAIPATGHVFDHWEGSGFYGETNQTINIVMDSNYSLKAVFVSDDDPVINFYTLNITIEGEGDVNLDPDRSSYSEGTSVDITAIPATGHVFDHWEGSGFDGETNQTINIMMDSNYSLKAVFVSDDDPVINFYTLNITIEGEGDVNLDPDRSSYSEGTAVDITAIPATGHEFDHWEGSGFYGETNQNINIVMDSNYSLKAVFVSEGNTVINFADPDLEDVIRNKIDKPTGEIYESDVEEIISLTATSSNIDNLSGIEYLINLEYLDLWDNQVSDISPLSNLTNLTSLNFESNQVSDISPLSNLTNLTHLYFGNNQVSDISPLSNLTNLIHLHLSNNQVSDISPLSNLTNLTLLEFCDNQVSEISPLSNLTNLTTLCFGNNQVSDISALVDNSGLNSWTAIWMQYNNLDLTAGSEDMKNIEDLLERGVTIYYIPQN